MHGEKKKKHHILWSFWKIPRSKFLVIAPSTRTGSLGLTCSPADPRSVRRLHSWVPAIRWGRTVRSAACCRTTDPTGCNAALRSSWCSAVTQKRHSFTQGRTPGTNWGGGGHTHTATYLGHLHLLHGADHIRCFFAPVALHDVALYGRAINGHDGVSCCLVGVEPENVTSYAILTMSNINTDQQVDLPHKGVAFVWEDTDFHNMAKRREGLSHNLFYKQEERLGFKYAVPGRVRWPSSVRLTRETCRDPPTVNGAVAGAGLIDHLIKRQLLGVGRWKGEKEKLHQLLN